MRSTKDIGEKVCEALGVDPNVVSQISFEWYPFGEPVIKFGYIMKPGQAAELAQIFKRYRLELIDTDAEG